MWEGKGIRNGDKLGQYHRDLEISHLQNHLFVGYIMRCKSSPLFLYIVFLRHLWHDFDKLYHLIFLFLLLKFWTFTTQYRNISVFNLVFTLSLSVLHLEVHFQSQLLFLNLLQRKEALAQITSGSWKSVSSMVPTYIK